MSRITVRKAIDGLAEEGVARQPTRLRQLRLHRIDKNFAKLTSFSEDMRARGRNPRSVWLKRSEGTVTPEESLKLALSPGTLVYRFHRLRLPTTSRWRSSSRPSTRRACPSLDAVEDSLYDALERAGNRPVRALLQRLHSDAALTAEQAKLLKARTGDAGAFVERLGVPA